MPKPISFHYDLMSQPSRALWIIFKMSGTQFEDCPVALRQGEHLTEEFKKEINRFQRVPCINDNGYKLAESIAILRYLSLNGKISPQLYPIDIKAKIRVDEYLEWQHMTIRLGCSMYFRKKFLEPKFGAKELSPEKLEVLKNIMEGSLDILENVWLEKTKYIAGNELTAADIFAACELEQTRMAGYDPCDKYPKIRDWLTRVRSELKPFYEAAHVFVNKIVGAQSKL